MLFDISLVSFTALIKLFDCVLIAWKIEKNIFRLVQEMEIICKFAVHESRSKRVMLPVIHVMEMYGNYFQNMYICSLCKYQKRFDICMTCAQSHKLTPTLSRCLHLFALSNDSQHDLLHGRLLKQQEVAPLGPKWQILFFILVDKHRRATKQNCKVFLMLLLLFSFRMCHLCNCDI